jgi:hypothetical protein
MRHRWADTLVEELAERMRAAARDALAARQRGGSAAGEAAALQRRARLLREFVGRTRRDPSFLPRRCAWCHRIEVEGEYVDPNEFLEDDLPERLRERATHGICPECLERVQREADELRTARRPGE